MTTTPVRLLTLFASIVAASLLVRADDPAPVKEKDSEALPQGAKVQFGSGKYLYRGGYTLLPPEYKTILTTEGGPGFRRYELATGLPIDAPRAGGGAGFLGGALIASADGKRVVSTGTGILTVRGALTGAEIKALQPPADFGTSFTTGFHAVSLSADGKRLAQGGSIRGAKGGVLVWDVDKGEVLARIETKFPAPNIPVISADGKFVAVRPYNFNQPVVPGMENDPQRSIVVWDVDGKKEILDARITPPSYQAPDVALTPDGSLMAAAFGDGPIEVWDVKAGKSKTTILGRTGQGVRIAFSPDGKALAAVAVDGTIQRWGTEDFKLIGTTEAPDGIATIPQGIAFAEKDRVVAWTANGMAAVVWEAPSGKLLTQTSEHTAGIKSIGFAPNGKEIISGGLDGRVIRWDIATGKPLGAVTLRVGKVPGGYTPPIGVGRAVQISADGSRGISINSPAAVFDLKTGVEQFAIPRGSIRHSTYHIASHDATKVISLTLPFDAKANGNCVIWDVAERKKATEFELAGMTTGGIPAASFSPDGTRMVLAGVGRTVAGANRGLVITGWDLKTGKKLSEIEDKETYGAISIAAASNTSAIMTFGSGRVVAIDFEGGRMGEEIENTRRGDGYGIPVSFSPDGKRFAVAGPGEMINTYTIRIYDWPRARLLHTFTGHKSSITTMNFSPDGKHLATGSSDTTVLLWDMGEVKDK